MPPLSRWRPGRHPRPVSFLWMAALMLLACRVATPPPQSPAEAPPEVAEAAPEAVVPVSAPPASPPPPPVVSALEHEVEIPVRVGLLTDAEELAFPCCDLVLRARTGERVVVEAAGLRVLPAGGRAGGDVYRLQVAALKDRAQAEALAARLGRETGHPAEAVPDAASGLYRVRVGRWRDRDGAEAAASALASRGLARGWVVTEGGAVEAPALTLVRGHEELTIPGRWLDFERVEGDGIPVAGGRYRGRIRAYLNDRGLLNVINELPLEEYLRGVVPREMGPSAYSAIAALEAQTVAARTYTVRNLGDFEREGFDLCPTPRCQVYGGMAAEHALSDRAIANTRGLVLLWQGRPIDALYSSTCGGHTEDVGTVFPGKGSSDAYLRGVPCLEGGEVSWRGGDGPAALADLLLGPAGSGSDGFATQAGRLAAAAGLPAPAGAPRDLGAAELHRWLVTAFDLALEPALLVAPAVASAASVPPPPALGSRSRRLAAELAAIAGVRGPLSRQARQGLLVGLAEAIGAVERQQVRFVRLDGAALLVRDEAGAVRPLPAAIPVYRGASGEAARADLALAPGDVLDVYARGGVPLAVAQPDYRAPTTTILNSKWRRWERFKSDRELAAAVAARLPGFRLESFEVLDRGISGRVGRLRLLGAGGRSEVLEGLAVRWALDLPDTLFTARRTTGRDGAPGWLFSGHGLGHGVGMCQVGSYGMARRGHRSEDILRWYYWGAELGSVSGVRGVTRQVAR